MRTAARKSAADPIAVEQTLNSIFAHAVRPGQLTELRALDAVVRGDRYRFKTVSGYYVDYTKLAADAATIESAKGIYFIPNPVNPRLLARANNRLRCERGELTTTGDADIVRREWLLVDIDPQRPAGTSSSDEEHDAAIALANRMADDLAADGWPSPILADSGNGAHLLYRIDLHTDDDGLCQRCLQALAAKYNAADELKVDETTFNPARIWKLYGTVAVKGDPLPRYPHRMSRLLDVPSKMAAVPLDLLQALAADASQPEQPKPSNGHHEANGHDYARLYVDRWLGDRGYRFHTKQLRDGRTAYILDRCPFNESHGSSTEVAVFQWPNGKLCFECKHSSCSNKGWQQAKEAIGKPGPEHYDRPFREQSGQNVHSAKNAEPARSKAIERMTSAELDAGDFHLRYLIDQVVPEAQGGILSGRFKTLKTSGAIDLAISAATATHFLGRFVVPEQLRCGIISAESGAAILQETGRRVARSKGFELGSVENLIWSTSLPRLPTDMELLERFIIDDGLRLLLLDPSYLMFAEVGDSASNVFKMGGLLTHITELVKATQCTIILLNHNRKGRGPNAAQFDPPELSEISMSGFAEWARFWLLLGPRQEWDETTGRHWLWLRTGGPGHAGLFALDVFEGKRTDEGGRVWDVSVNTASDAKREVEREREHKKAEAQEQKEAEYRRRLVEAMRQYPDGETEKQLRLLARLNPENFGLALLTLKKRGEVEQVEVQKGGRKHIAWRLKK